MTITSAGTFVFTGSVVTCNDTNVTDTAIILITPQLQASGNTPAWFGSWGVTSRVAGTSFTVASSKAGNGFPMGYVILQP